MELLTTINEDQIPEEEYTNFSKRKATRGVIFDGSKNIALIHNTEDDFYGLPGGGVKENETLESCLKREIKEETGCSVEIIQELGKIIEISKKNKIVYEDTGYTVKIVGEKGVTNFRDDEVSVGACVVWLPINEAVQKIKSNGLPRDLIFINAISKY